MRAATLILALSLVACASQPTGGGAKQSRQASAAPASPAPAATGVDPKALVDARKLGFEATIKGGVLMYCRQVKKTGSRISAETVCMTPEEFAALRFRTQEEYREAVLRAGQGPAK